MDENRAGRGQPGHVLQLYGFERTGELHDDKILLRLEMSSGQSQAEAIDPSVTSPLCAANADRTSSFSREGTPK